jgi:hypothetical protein
MGPGFEKSNIRRILIPCAILVVLIAVATKSGAVEQVWRALTGNRMPIGAANPVAAAKPVLSEHEREWISQQAPQTQMEELMRDAINHDEGATQMIARLLPTWGGHLKNSKNWNDLMMTALYSNDLRVRAAAIEVNLSVNNLGKNPTVVDQMIDHANDDTTARPWAAWMLGMLANRGVSTDKVVATLEDWLHDPDEQTRIWSVEGLALVGTDRTIDDFLYVLKNDDSPKVRERAGCSLAKSGMLTRVQRMHAVPGLIDLASDTSLDPQTRNWVYQALREITEQNLSNSPDAWRDWYLSNGQEQTKKFADADGNQVLGNS